MLRKGTRLNDTYIIEEEIGAGGGGVVYKAYHERLKTWVVVKQIREKVKGILESRAEADILKRIKHTYLPRVYDFLEADGEIYTVMDYVPGRSLDKVLKEEKKIAPGQVLKWAEQLAEALAYLHGQTPPIIHSDIKPANIMLTPEGNICLIDFNISLAFDSGMKTSTGTSGGYSPPEQYGNIGGYRRSAGLLPAGKEPVFTDETAAAGPEGIDEDATVTVSAGKTAETKETETAREIESMVGRGVDERSDIYSLGATLYHLLTGVKPDRNFEKIVPIDRYDLNLGKGFLVILRKMMQLRPEDRYQNGGELLYALQHIYELDDEYKAYRAGRRGLKLLTAALWIAGILLTAAGAGLRVRELNTSYNRSVDAAETAMENGDFEAARGYVETAKATLPGRIQAYEKEALLLYRTGDHEGTIRYISDIIQNPAYAVKEEEDKKALADIYYIAAHSYMEMEDYSNAALNLEKAVRLDPTNSLYFRDYAISQAKQGKTEEAEACLEEAVKLGLGEDSIYMVRGEVSFVQNRYEEAAEYLEQAISTSTDGDLRKRAVLLYDDIFRELGDAYLEEEIAFLEQEESRESGSAAGMNLTERLADAYARKAEADGESREEYYRKALDRFLALYENGYTTRQMMENIAIIRQALGEYDQAEEMLFAMAEQYPDSYISYKRLAYLEAERQQEKENQERDYSRMKEYYDRARELYGDQDTDQEMQMLDNLIRDLKDGNWL